MITLQAITGLSMAIAMFELMVIFKLYLDNKELKKKKK